MTAATLRPADFATKTATVRIGRVSVTRDWDSGRFFITGQGGAGGATRSWGRMVNMVAGLA